MTNVIDKEELFEQKRQQQIRKRAIDWATGIFDYFSLPESFRQSFIATFDKAAMEREKDRLEKKSQDRIRQDQENIRQEKIRSYLLKHLSCSDENGLSLNIPYESEGFVYIFLDIAQLSKERDQVIHCEFEISVSSGHYKDCMSIDVSSNSEWIDTFVAIKEKEAEIYYKYLTETPEGNRECLDNEDLCKYRESLKRKISMRSARPKFS